MYDRSISAGRPIPALDLLCARILTKFLVSGISEASNREGNEAPVVNDDESTGVTSAVVPN